MFNGDKLTRDAAQTLCIANGGRLYEPMSDDFANDADYTAVIDSLQNAINNQAEAWIGIEDTSDDNTANDWFFSSSGNAVNSFNWRESNNYQQPVDGSGRCVYLRA